MLESEHFSGAAQTSLDFIGNQKRPVLPAKFLRAREEISLRSLAAFALNRFNYKRGNVARTQLSIQLVDVVERDARVETFHQRTESFGETVAAHQRERADAQTVERARQ